MPHISIAPGKLGVVIKADIRARHAATMRGVRKGQAQGVTLLKQRTPVDQGAMRAAWGTSGDQITNDAPHAGVVERGARPHKVNAAGVQAIFEWVRRHGLGDMTNGKDPEKQAWSVTWAIIKKIELKGQEGTFFVQKSLPELNNLLKAAVEDELAKAEV